MTLKKTLLILTLLVAMPFHQARAESVLFSVQSEYKYIVHLSFFSDDRDWQWPGGDEVYVLKDYEIHDFSLECQSGESICYGAWPKGSRKKYWGVGIDGKQSCEKCCITCNGGESGVIVLSD